MSWDAMIGEWRDSVNRLSDILGEEVITASVPGGYYSEQVAMAASVVGVRALFTSEPTRRSHMVGTCRVFGRYVILAGTAHDRAVQLLRGSYLLRSKEHVVWTLKKAGKTFGGEAYLKLRAMALQRGLF